MPRTMILILLSILPFITAQTFAPTFVGCVSTISGPPLAADSATSASECATYCGSVAASNPLFRLHSYYQQDGPDDQGYCQCTQFGPVSVGYEDSSSIATPDVCADPTSYSVYRLATTFVFDACYTTVNNPNDVPETVDSLEEVFEACRSFRNVFVVPLPAESGFQYVCATTETFSTPTTCNDPGSFFVFSHDAGSTVSQLTRKRKRARARAMRDKSQLVDFVAARMGGLAGHFPHPVSEPQREYCPKEMTACKVFGSEGAYECIDTSSELESCGGCMYGVFDLISGEVEKLGVNCASLDDWSHGFGRKTCQSGNCVDLR